MLYIYPPIPVLSNHIPLSLGYLAYFWYVFRVKVFNFCSLSLPNEYLSTLPVTYWTWLINFRHLVAWVNECFIGGMIAIISHETIVYGGFVDWNFALILSSSFRHKTEQLCALF